jgi:signal transduction histidine kinase/ferredoxin
MPKITVLPDRITLDAKVDQTILDASLAGGIPHTNLCGGKSRCSTCRVLVLEGLERCLPRNTREQKIADQLHYHPALRLACQTTAEGDITLRRLVVDQEDLAVSSQFVVERVRAEVMAMRGTDDFVNIVRVLWEGLRDVGLDVDYCALDVLDEDPSTCETYTITSDWLHKDYGVVPIQQNVVFGGHYYSRFLALDTREQNMVLNESQVVSIWSTDEERVDYLTFIHRCWGDPVSQTPSTPRSWINVPFSHGRISVHSFDPDRFLPQDMQLIEIFADAVSLAYTRFLDFRHLEAQNAELQDAYRQLKETQAELIQAEKMASLGELVAGVAHEINTPLGAIKSSIDTARRGMNRVKQLVPDQHPESGQENPASDRIFSRMDQLHHIVQQAVDRMDIIVASLRKFARLDSPDLDMVDIHEGIESTLVLVGHELRHRIEVNKSYGPPALLQCYPNQLNQVFMNLLINATQAIEGKGVITIRTLPQNGTIVVEITDTGKGIAPEHLARIFNPGFTTKGSGIGMGLGLSIVHQIVEQHRGKMDVESTVGEGTTFRLTLPLVQPPSDQP